MACKRCGLGQMTACEECGYVNCTKVFGDDEPFPLPLTTEEVKLLNTANLWWNSLSVEAKIEVYDKMNMEVGQ